MSASTAELTAARPLRPRPPLGPTVATRRLSTTRVYLWAAVAALALAALSLLIPSTPSYDPWAWLVWGREIIHLNLQTTGGPSWKPLPMLFTTPFSLFGGAAPDLWLVVARAGALLAVVMTFRLAWRLTRDLSAEPHEDEAWKDGRTQAAWGERRTQAAWGDGRTQGPSRDGRTRVVALLRGPALAPLLAGLIAAVGLINSVAFISDNALGYSEGLAVALLLFAVERHLDGARRQAFVAGFFVALDRPEIWVFWVPYGLLLLRREPGARRLVLALFALIPLLWFGPELWGSGHLLRNVTRALHPRSNSPAFARCPVCTVFGQEAWPAVLNRLKTPAVIAMAVAAVRLLRPGAGWRGARVAGPPPRAQAWLLAIGLFGFIWWFGIALETQLGFSGNRRYLLLGTAPVTIAGGVAWGWLAQAAPGWVRRLSGSPVPAPAAVLAAAALFVLIPPWMGTIVGGLRRTHGALVYQARLREDLAAAVHRLGRRQILGCGTVMTEGFQVPMLAYMLDVHTLRVQAPPAVAGTGTPPNVIFQAAAQRRGRLLPIIRPWHVDYSLVDRTPTFRVFMNCAARAAT